MKTKERKKRDQEGEPTANSTTDVKVINTYVAAGQFQLGLVVFFTLKEEQRGTLEGFLSFNSSGPVTREPLNAARPGAQPEGGNQFHSLHQQLTDQNVFLIGLNVIEQKSPPTVSTSASQNCSPWALRQTDGRTRYALRKWQFQNTEEQRGHKERREGREAIEEEEEVKVGRKAGQQSNGQTDRQRSAQSY